MSLALAEAFLTTGQVNNLGKFPNLLFVSKDLPILDIYVNRIMQYEFFQDSLTYQYLLPFYDWILLNCLDYIVMPAVRIPQQEKIRPP